MKNTLTHIVNYEKTICDKKNWKVWQGVQQFRKSPPNVLRLKKAYRLKISQSIIYTKVYFLCFSLPWKILYKHKVKQMTYLARTL